MSNPVSSVAVVARSLSSFITATAVLLLILSSAGLSACAREGTTTSPASLPAASSASPAAATATPAVQLLTPSDTVREFYKAMRERRFREAFALSIYQPAIEGMTPDEFEELRPEFEKIAAAVPEQIAMSGEQISGDAASVFAKVSNDNPSAPPEEIKLMRVKGQWIFGDSEGQKAVQREGKQFFTNARIKTHHEEVKAVLLRVANAEALYASQHAGMFADLDTLVLSNPSLKEDLDGSGTLGYQFRVTLGKDGKSYAVNAEPARHGRTGLLSFHMDSGGIQSRDNGGKTFTPSKKK